MLFSILVFAALSLPMKTVKSSQKKIQKYHYIKVRRAALELRRFKRRFKQITKTWHGKVRKFAQFFLERQDGNAFVVVDRVFSLEGAYEAVVLGVGRGCMRVFEYYKVCVSCLDVWNIAWGTC